jgi:phosphomannomutase
VNPLEAAKAWLAEDPDPVTRAELESLIAAGDIPAVSERFSGRLEFGTAGLRGELGAGPMRMNRVTVIRAAAGLAAYLKSRGDTAPVVIGYDARHCSDVFARDTAAVITGAGFPALVLPHPLPTPVLAFAIRHLACSAGVMVTASHNPPRDNGYKVYLGDGSQIVPPADIEISACIDAVGPLGTVPLGEEWQTLDNAIVDAYLERVAALVDPSSPRDLRVAYTPLHGVGRDVLLQAFKRAGFPEPAVVAEQGEPDPDFPTVAFPNPEEPGAMDLALALGQSAKADLVIANDPDADRCAIAVPIADGFRMLRGDEVGVLLAVHLLRRGATGVFATTIVSSTLLSKVAASYGVGYAETLTGFKWLSRVRGLRFGYEEALGYCVDPDGVCDKDGISAALLVAELAATLRHEGRTLLDLLDDIAQEFGLHATEQLSVRVQSLTEIDTMMARLRETPPESFGGERVLAIDDLSLGSDDLPPTEGLRYRLAEGSRIVVRPSGTEPKLKAYLEVVVTVASGLTVADARVRAHERIETLRGDLVSALGVT